VFDQTSYDFGDVEQGARVAHTYTFRNDGGLDLTIDNVRAFCGCTAAVASARVVSPGGAGRIEVTFDTARDFGRTPRSITVYTNDPLQPVTTLALVGNVDADVAVDPVDLYVGHLRRGEAARNSARVLAPHGAVAVGPVEAHGRVIEAALREPAAGAAARLVRIAIQKDAPVGRFKEDVVVHTNSPRRPLVTLAVTGVVDGDSGLATGQP
jgi:uncharacterized protein DUF1573